ncbi:hypothetical protein [Roseisalinus antarcticus]|uniref:Uncharacterized protein n=1 Tax=Roseisalinus antarcticus TaxID=254357 RepID=A0A1Y5S4T9_9RHOB|nr:hypothetical protein [Roseisalinus antarcticus]SLN32640.1 hypothetical protein ROA7023_01125 [Roseisalinus antarcticus]
MTAPETLADAISRVQSARWPQRLIALIGAAAIQAAFAVPAFALLGDENPFAWSTAIVGAFGAGFFLYWRHLAGADSAAERLLPHMLPMVAPDLRYTRHPTLECPLLDDCPAPIGAVYTPQDGLVGTYEGIPLTSMEIASFTEVRTGSDKRLAPLFRGIVVMVPASPDGDFLLAVGKSPPIKAEVLGGGPITSHVFDMAGQDRCIAQPDGLEPEPVVDRLKRLQGVLPKDVHLLAVRQTGGTARIALKMDRDPYGLGGVFTSRDTLGPLVNQTLGDLGLAPAVALVWAGTDE